MIRFRSNMHRAVYISMGVDKTTKISFGDFKILLKCCLAVNEAFLLQREKLNTIRHAENMIAQSCTASASNCWNIKN